jgi:hypothetical protein
MIPLFFQVILQDNPSEAGMRLVIPSLATPAGGLVAGIIMSRWGRLSGLVQVGCLLMMVGNGLIASLLYKDASWKYLVYLFPANFGQGMSYPAILFTNLAAFDHNRKFICLDRFHSANVAQITPCLRRWYIYFARWERSGELRPLRHCSRMYLQGNFHQPCQTFQTKNR